MPLNRAVGETFCPSVAGVRTVTESGRACRSQKLACPSAFCATLFVAGLPHHLQKLFSPPAAAIELARARVADEHLQLDPPDVPLPEPHGRGGEQRAGDALTAM